ncbi:MAG TPA: GntR family transcriptional regulator [Chloroflexaceae bacterium]|nr:GntR family transcriptional regulator [Chloroflexaceae bacterium]
MSDHGLARENGQRELRARDLERLIEEQIRAGAYEGGARLPTVRELAQRYSVNKNTASRAYQALARRGLIDLSRGRGAFVSPPEGGDGASWEHRVEQLVQSARQLGLSRAELLDAVGRAVERAFGAAPPRVVFVECNQQDLEALGDELGAITGTPMELAMLDEALGAAEALARRYDLVVTTFQHLGELRQATPAPLRDQVVGVHVAPTHDTLLDLARLHVATFGLVCDTPSTIESLAHIIATYNPSAAILPALIDDERQLARALAQADAVVVTRSCRERLAALGLELPLVTVVFTIDQQSIDFLRRRLQELRQPRATPVAP